jgi:nucleotide-binding universal stress UspA family protein
MPSAVEHENILIAIDDSAATWRAVDYVADLGRTSQRLCVHLFHADFYPPDLQESRGGTTANEEEEVEAQLERKQQRWERRMQGAAAHLFNKARGVLESAGTAPDQIQCHVVLLAHREELTDQILNSAREFGCGTIVIGRNSFHWLKELFVDHLSEEISRRAQKLYVKVIE